MISTPSTAARVEREDAVAPACDLLAVYPSVAGDSDQRAVLVMVGRPGEGAVPMWISADEAESLGWTLLDAVRRLRHGSPLSPVS